MDKYLIKKRTKDEQSIENNENVEKKQKKEQAPEEHVPKEHTLTKIDLRDESTIYWCKHFMTSEDATNLFQHLLKELNWVHGEVPMYGKKVKTPRLQSWMADEGVKASLYQKQKQHPWTEPVLELKKKLEDVLHCKFDYLLLNLYRNGNDYIGWHSDGEALAESKSIIASISLGETRKFFLKHNKTDERIEYQLNHGSLIVMAGKTQKHWKHHIPKQLHISKPRLNLTFRIS